MIHIVGDIHGDLKKLLQIFEDLPCAGEHHYCLCCGDFGFLMDGTSRREEALAVLEGFSQVSMLFVDGNHEAYPVLNSLPVVRWNGANVSFLRQNVIHIKRGEVLELEGKTIFCLGGAASPDRQRRLMFGLPWYAEEVPSVDEIGNAWQNLERYDYQVDVVVTHTAPSMVQRRLGFTRPLREEMFLVQTLDDICRRTKVRNGWFFGHFHEDCSVRFLDTAFYACLNEVHRLPGRDD